MSFYVTLPSNSSTDLFDNTISDFTTQLKIPIRLSGPYEVALVEITYDHCWDVDLGKITYYHSFENVKFNAPIILKDGESFKSFLDRINSNIGPAIMEYDMNLFLNNKNNNPDLKSNTEAKEAYQKYLIKNELPPPILVYLNNKLHVNTIKSDHFFVFEGIFGQLLGIENEFINKNSKDIPIDNFGENFHYIRSLYVYTDIVKYQYVGDTLAPLLRNVVVPPNNSLSTQTVIFDSPHYLPVNKSVIETINIKITDEQGNNIKFRRGKSIIKLHFRPNGF